MLKGLWGHNGTWALISKSDYISLGHCSMWQQSTELHTEWKQWCLDTSDVFTLHVFQTSVTLLTGWWCYDCISIISFKPSVLFPVSVSLKKRAKAKDNFFFYKVKEAKHFSFFAAHMGTVCTFWVKASSGCYDRICQQKWVWVWSSACLCVLVLQIILCSYWVLLYCCDSCCTFCHSDVGRFIKKSFPQTLMSLGSQSWPPGPTTLHVFHHLHP